MLEIPYINYKELDEFYTVNETCQLLHLDKATLRKKCEQYGIQPRRNEIGDYGLVKYDVRKLHNLLYYEDRDRTGKPSAKDDDPWA